MQKNKLKEIEKILITQKRFELLPKGIINLKRPFRIVELVEVLQPIFERMKSKKENNKVLGYISFIISDRKLIYKDKQSVLLTEKESDIFVSLLNSENRGITKEEVMSKVWMLNPNMETHTFETHLYRLRKKIKEEFNFKLDTVLGSKSPTAPVVNKGKHSTSALSSATVIDVGTDEAPLITPLLIVIVVPSIFTPPRTVVEAVGKV